MSRKKSAPKKILIVDPIYKSTIIPKLINSLMYDGKKTVAEKIVYDAIDRIKSKSKEEPIKESLTFPSPVITQEAILAAVEILITRAFLRPEVRGKNIRGITLKSNVIRHPTWQKQFTFKDPTPNVKKAYQIIKNSFDNIKIPGPLEDITLSISGLSGESGIQTSLLTDIRKRAQLREMMNLLESQLGHKPPIYQVKDIEPWSRTPERRQVLTTFEP